MVALASWLTPEETSPDSENRVWDFFGPEADFVGELALQVVEGDWEKSFRLYDSRRGYVLDQKEKKEEKPKEKKRCTWWQITKAYARAIDSNFKVESGVGLGVGLKGNVLGYGIEGEFSAMEEFSFDFRNAQARNGSVTTQGISINWGSKKFGETIKQSEYFETTYNDSFLGMIPLDGETRYVGSHVTSTRTESVHSGPFSLKQDTIGLGGTAVFIKGSLEFNAGQAGRDIDSILRNEYDCDPTM